jgi:hypothetical protein
MVTPGTPANAALVRSANAAGQITPAGSVARSRANRVPSAIPWWRATHAARAASICSPTNVTGAAGGGLFAPVF